jgi:hypothetical protein
VIEAADARFDLTATRELLLATGCAAVEEVTDES